MVDVAATVRAGMCESSREQRHNNPPDRSEERTPENACNRIVLRQADNETDAGAYQWSDEDGKTEEH